MSTLCQYATDVIDTQWPLLCGLLPERRWRRGGRPVIGVECSMASSTAPRPSVRGTCYRRHLAVGKRCMATSTVGGNKAIGKKITSLSAQLLEETST